MKDIKLKGMKQFREINNISLEKVATNINLMKDSDVNFVVTSDYLAKIENRKQKEIDDNLLHALSKYLGLEINELIDLNFNYNTDINENVYGDERIITINLLTNDNEKITRNIEVPIDMPIKTVNTIIDLIRLIAENNKVNLGPDSIIEHLLNIIKYLKVEPKYKDILKDDYLLVKYVDIYFDKIGNNFLDNYMGAANSIYTYYKKLGYTDEICLHFVDILMNIFIDHGIL